MVANINPRLHIKCDAIIFQSERDKSVSFVKWKTFLQELKIDTGKRKDVGRNYANIVSITYESSNRECLCEYEIVNKNTVRDTNG